MTLLCGLYSEQIYGTDRDGRPAGQTQNRWGGSIEISPGLELAKLMLQYCLFTSDTEFLKSDVVPYAKDLFLYVETRFRFRKDGKIVIGPLNCVETYFDTVNPVPVTAGMRSVLDELLEWEMDEEDRKYFAKSAKCCRIFRSPAGTGIRRCCLLRSMRRSDRMWRSRSFMRFIRSDCMANI